MYKLNMAVCQVIPENIIVMLTYMLRLCGRKGQPRNADHLQGEENSVLCRVGRTQRGLAAAKRLLAIGEGWHLLASPGPTVNRSKLSSSQRAGHSAIGSIHPPSGAAKARKWDR